jgi:hypothetical protein
MHTSFPRAAVIGQADPNGPRRPITSPRFTCASPVVTVPTLWIVWASIPPCEASELIDIAASPSPNTYSMLNCPGRKLNVSPIAPRSIWSVKVSSVSQITFFTVTVWRRSPSP